MSDLEEPQSPDDAQGATSDSSSHNATSDELAAQLEQLDTVITAILGTANHSEEELRATIEKFRGTVAPLASESDCEDLARRLIDRLSIDVERGVAVRAKDFKPWLEDKKRDITWTRWKTYKQYLLNSKWPGPVVENLDELTDDILDFAGDPTEPGPWARRGLVLGDVQSGKTASYLALFNKAADAGYRLIIVLAGHTESLRQQTQRRVDEGFTGRDTRRKSTRGVTANQQEVGVGLINRQIAGVVSMTTMTSDFSTSSQEAISLRVDPNSPNPYVFVVKKNVGKNKKGDLTGILPSLSRWLEEQPRTAGKIDVPVLVLDDESDYASVNTRKDEDPTAVNDSIRSILAQFSMSSYVAFTATPFANIFIDYANTDDLFPRDFIYALEAPSNYVGAEQTFGRSDDKNATNVIDLDDIADLIPLNHKTSLQVPELPESLVTAVRAFFITNAIRDLRGHKQARAMLVNVSRWKNVQRQMYELVGAEVARIKNAIELHSVAYASGEPNHELDEIKQVYADLFEDCGSCWEEVLSALEPAVSDIRVQLFNSDNDRRLEEDQITWDRPKRLIAVGGDVLSRGLTLEGLSTSYFWRKTAASDTLLQMARWFGYRDGYHDLCRLWIDSEVADYFRFIADSVDELRRDLRRMFEQQLTPKDFGLAVRKHPESLLVTARNKMRSTETRKAIISVLGRRIETVKLPANAADLRSNFAALRKFLQDVDVADYQHDNTFRGYRWWQNVPRSLVADLLETFKAHSTAEIFSQSALGKYVRKARFHNWDVVLVNGSKKETPAKIERVEFFPPSRTFLTGGQPVHKELRLGGQSARLAGADDLANLLGQEAANAVKKEFEAREPDKSMPETEFYRHLERPALLIYALRAAAEKAVTKVATDPAKREKEKEKKAKFHEAAEIVENARVLVVALKLAFPGESFRDDSGDIEYVINPVALDTWFINFDDSSDDEDVDA
jgi:hypothetical protein